MSKLEKCYKCGKLGSWDMIPTTTVGKFICFQCAKKEKPEISGVLEEEEKLHGLEMSSRNW